MSSAAQELRAVLALARTGSGLAPWMTESFTHQSNMAGWKVSYFIWMILDDFPIWMPNLWGISQPCSMTSRYRKLVLGTGSADVHVRSAPKDSLPLLGVHVWDLSRRVCLKMGMPTTWWFDCIGNMITHHQICFFWEILGIPWVRASAWDGGRPHWSGSTEVGGPREIALKVNKSWKETGDFGSWKEHQN